MIKRKVNLTKTHIENLITIKKAFLPELEIGAESVGSCWESEKLGFARGYIHAMQEILKTAKLPKGGGWVKAGPNEYGPPID